MISLIIAGTFGRYVLVSYGLQPFPNFEIIMVLTFIAAIFLKPTVAIAVPLLSMLLSDMLIGNSVYTGSQINKIILFTYSGFALIALSTIFSRDKVRKGFGDIRLKNIGIAAGLGVGFVLIYDVWTNLGWWYLIYPHNINSLALVFSAGMPFMAYHMLSGALTFIVVALPVINYITKRTSIELPIKLDNRHLIPAIAITLSLIFLSI
jgi:hypothetical protein